MRNCDFKGECYFLNVTTANRPITTADEKLTYCDGDPTKCTIYRIAKTHGIAYAPSYVFPGDDYELNSRIIENRLRYKVPR